MILVVDIGNSNTVFGLFESNDSEPIFHKRTVTRRDRTSDEWGLYLRGFLREAGIDLGGIQGGIYSSVVPSINPMIERMFEDWFQLPALPVEYTMKLPFRIEYPRPFEIGADRLVNAAACTKYYPEKCIIIDLGTATTFCVLDKNPDFIYKGGVIAPGLKISMEALTNRAAKLPPIVFQSPGKILGDSTLESIQAGFFYGWIGLLKEIILEIRKNYGEDFQVIGTGGLVSVIDQEYPGLFQKIDPMLTLKGLRELFLMNSQG